ncbi:MAG: xylulokinase [Acidimicrobiales bacterium]
MRRHPCLLGIDLGTGSTKAILLDPSGVELAVASVPVPLSRPRPGWVESDPEDWWSSVKSAVAKVLAASESQVCAIGLSGQMHGVVLTRPDGRALRPAVLWLDRRAEGCLGAYRALRPATRAVLGNPLVPGMAGPLLHWLAAQEPAVLRDAEWALQPKDWLRLRLVGHAGSEASDASGTLLFDLFQNTWALPVVEALGIPARLLPPLSASDDVAGRLDASVAGELGLPGGIPVAFGAADTAAALVGTGLSWPGPVQLTVGSAAQVVTLRRLPRPDPELRYHVYASAVPGLWYAMAAVQAAGIALSWALNTFNATWEEAYEILDAVPRGGAGSPVFIPHLAGARSPSMNTSARAGFLGLELSHDRADLLRAVFYGVAFSIAEAAGALPEFVDSSELYLAGGGTLHRTWRQLLCDVLGKKLLIVENPNASARGAALLGGRASGVVGDPGGAPPVTDEVRPERRAHESLAEAFGRWKTAEITCVGKPSR